MDAKVKAIISAERTVRTTKSDVELITRAAVLLNRVKGFDKSTAAIAADNLLRVACGQLTTDEKVLTDAIAQ